MVAVIKLERKSYIQWAGRLSKVLGTSWLFVTKREAPKLILGRSVPSSAPYFCWNELQLLLIVLGELLKGALLWVEM